MPAPPTSEPAVAGLLARAFDRCRGPEVNERLETLRATIEANEGRAFSYEVLLRGTGLPGLPVRGKGWAFLRDRVAPRLAYLIRGLKLRVLSAPGVFLTIFDGDDVYFVKAADFFAHYRETEQLSDLELARLVQRWESDQGADSDGAEP
jgi:hypothetical protein